MSDVGMSYGCRSRSSSGGLTAAVQSNRIEHMEDLRFDTDEQAFDLLGSVAESLREIVPGSFCRIGGTALLDVAQAVEAVQRQLFAVQVCIADEINAQGLASSMSSPSTAALLAQQLLIPPHQAQLRVRTAQACLSQDSMIGEELPPVLPLLGAAVMTGSINSEQIRSIVTTMKGLPAAVDAESRELCERTMVLNADVTPPAQFEKFCRAVGETADPDGSLEDRRPEGRVELTVGARNRRTGLTPFSGKLDDVGVQALTKAITGLAAPRPTVGGERDLRSAAVRRGQAFVEMLQRFLGIGAAPLDHGVRPHITVQLPLDRLQDLLDETAVAKGFAAARFDSGEPVSPAVLRRLLCDAEVLPVVLGGDGAVLDVGQATRVFTKAMRSAIAARDGGCTWPGCDRPASWCDTHHVTWFSKGGATSVANGALLCTFHHTKIHQGDWQMRMTPSGPEFRPPDWMRSDGDWIHNTVHRLEPGPTGPRSRSGAGRPAPGGPPDDNSLDGTEQN